MPLSKRNRKGVFQLLAISMIIILTPRLYGLLAGNEPAVVSFEEFQEVEAELVNKIETKKSNRYSSAKTKYKAPKSKFDPNQYSSEDWQGLGLSEKQADVVLSFAKYEIKSNEALQKIYVIPEQLFDLIKDSTVYPVRKFDIQKDSKSTKKQIANVELNSANSEQLIQLPGIGDYYANKIIEYREKLGGFDNKEQLLEIWKFDADRLEKIRSYLTVNSAELTKLNINADDAKKLAGHPYVDYRIANSIVKMRSVHGNYKSIAGIKKSKLIDEEKFNQLKPYLKIK